MNSTFGLIKINIPVKLFFKVIKNNNTSLLCIYNENFTLSLVLKNSIIKVNNNLSAVCVQFKNPIILNKILENQLKLITHTLTSYFLKKIKIAGKSYRIEKIGRGFNLTVGHTLKTYIHIYNVLKKQTTKHKIIFFYLNLRKLQNNFFKIIYLRLWDVYTQRGLRFGKHKLFRKQGKKSTYV